MIVLATLAQLTWADSADIQSIEIFTTADRAVTGTDHNRFQSATVAVYVVDGLERFEAALSRGLPLHPSKAQPEAQRRLQQLATDTMAEARQASIGLAEAMQYSIDRYPAIVFDGHAVVYGETDLFEALERYNAWQRASAR